MSKPPSALSAALSNGTRTRGTSAPDSPHISSASVDLERESSALRLQHLVSQGLLAPAERDELEHVVLSTTLLTLSNALHGVQDAADDIFVARLQHLRARKLDANARPLDFSKVEAKVAHIVSRIGDSSASSEALLGMLMDLRYRRILDQFQDLMYQGASDEELAEWLVIVLSRLPSTPLSTIEDESPPVSPRSPVSPLSSPGSSSPPVSPPPSPSSRYCRRERLVHLLIHHQPNVPLRDSILLNFEQFISPEDMLQQLLRAFVHPPPSIVDSDPDEEGAELRCVLRAGGTVVAWMREFFHSYFTPAMVDMLDTFLDEQLALHADGPRRECLDLLRSTLDHFKANNTVHYPRPPSSDASPSAATPSPSPSPSSRSRRRRRRAPTPSSSSSGAPSNAPYVPFMLATPPEVMARALTALDWPLFTAIKPYELASRAWSHHPERCPAVRGFIARFNDLSYWVAREILRGRTTDDRATLKAQFVLIATECLKLHNFHTAFAINAAMTLHPVYRLKELRYVLNKQHQQLMDELKTMGSPGDNYSAYRPHLNACIEDGSTCIPHFAVTLKDLFALEEQTPHEKQTRLVDLERLSRVTERIVQVRLLQQRSYPPEVLDVNVGLLEKLAARIAKRYTENQLLKRSLYLEPKMTWQEHRQATAISILLQEGFL